jgi:hypothetical protein
MADMFRQRSSWIAVNFSTFALALALSWAAPLPAQEQVSATAPAQQQVTPGVAVDSARKTEDLPGYVSTSQNEGKTLGQYEVRQTFEFGGRIAAFNGNRGMWDSYVNLDSGPRLLEQTLDLHSASHTGLLFDDLSFANFGYGGDPNNVTRLQVQKGTLYNFQGNFRRDKNFFDYDLLANPLNPPSSNPNLPVEESPHIFETTRRMSDFNVNLFEQAPVRLRVGYGHYINDGGAFSTVHQGTEALLFQPTRNTSDNYQAGISFRILPRTSLNYDQFYTRYKNDSSWQLAGLPFQLPNGTAVDLGLPFNTVAGQPCAMPIVAAGAANPVCNGYFSYSRVGPIRNSYPVEQLSFQSNYLHALDMSGRVSYSGSDSDRPDYLETFNGLVTRTAERASQQTGPAHSRRVSATVDYATTIRLTDRFRIVDTFRFSNFRIPGTVALSETDLFGATLLSTPNTYNPATCPPPFTAAACPQHTASSGPDVIQSSIDNFLGQDLKINTFELEYDLTKRISARLGYRYQRRDIDVGLSYVQIGTFLPNRPTRGGCTQVANNICTLTTVIEGENDFTEINGHSGLFGFSARPTNSFRISFDTELYSADNTFTRIIPRQFQDYRLRTTYKPKDWMSFGSVVVIREGRNNVSDVAHLDHNRSYGFTAAVNPSEKFSLDLNYDYNDVFSQTNICFVTTPSPAVAISCGGAPFATGLSVYTERAHSGGGGLVFRPLARVTAGIGYTISSSVGSTLILNPNAPTGPLSYNYHLPQATLAIDLNKHLTYKTGWNFYDYHEKSDPGPTAPRNFRGNVFTLSMRYSM